MFSSLIAGGKVATVICCHSPSKKYLLPDNLYPFPQYQFISYRDWQFQKH